MIDLHLYAAFVAAVTTLMLIPGPNVALIVANSVAHGARYGLLTVAGTSAAMVLQLAVTAIGMAELLGKLGSWFEWIRWIGVAYLLYLGVTYWRAAPVDLTKVAPERKSSRAMFLRALLVSLSNPKTLLFYGAFFPQFLSGGPGASMEIALLSATFLALAIVVDGSWALMAARARRFLSARGRLRNRLAGGLMIGAGVGLALARKS
ncbi:LysE family translocator [Dongia deserti]|uniref:LysE family translocator n=1 Tax=Dongia deserti TaxID=2268030 RepID=UPI000E64F372|nr:LysE family translocator [Dongia deserti]